MRGEDLRFVSGRAIESASGLKPIDSKGHNALFTANP